MTIFLLQVGFLEPGPFATELSTKPIIKFSCTEPNIGSQSGAQHHIEFYPQCLVHSTGQGDLHLLVVKESLLNSSLHEKRQISWVMKYRSSLQHSSVKLLQNRSYFIKLDILAMPLGQSRSGYGLNFSGFILMIFFFFVWNVFYKAILLIKYRASNYCYTPAWYKMTLHRCTAVMY